MSITSFYPQLVGISNDALTAVQTLYKLYIYYTTYYVHALYPILYMIYFYNISNTFFFIFV